MSRFPLTFTMVFKNWIPKGYNYVQINPVSAACSCTFLLVNPHPRVLGRAWRDVIQLLWEADYVCNNMIYMLQPILCAIQTWSWNRRFDRVHCNNRIHAWFGLVRFGRRMLSEFSILARAGTQNNPQPLFVHKCIRSDFFDALVCDIPNLRRLTLI